MINNIYAWACDFEENRGEGILAREFIKFYFKNKIVIIKTPKIIYEYRNNRFYSIKADYNKKINHNFFFKYISPIFGIIYLWFYSLKKKETIYLNFLPLWNFFVFYFLPRKTILGPITGSEIFHSNGLFEVIIRKYLFPILYKINARKIKKKKKILFATDLLQNILPYDVQKKSIFNFQPISYFLNNKICKNKSIKKKYDFIIYYRDHENKNNCALIQFLNKLIKFKFNIIIVGDNLNINGVTNLGILSKKQIEVKIRQSCCTFISGENFYSFFSLDCLKNNLAIFHNYKKYPNKFLFYKKKIFWNISRDIKFKNIINIVNYKKKNMYNNLILKKKLIDKKFTLLEKYRVCF